MTNCMVISLQIHGHTDTTRSTSIYNTQAHDNHNGFDEEKTVGISIKMAYGGHTECPAQ